MQPQFQLVQPSKFHLIIWLQTVFMSYAICLLLMIVLNLFWVLLPPMFIHKPTDLYSTYKGVFCDLFQGFELNGTRIAVRYPDRIPQGMGISRSALKADDLQDENVGWVLLYSTLHPTLLYRDCAIPTGCVKGDNDLKVVPHFGKYVNLLSFLALNEKVDTTNVCAVSHVSFFFL